MIITHPFEVTTPHPDVSDRYGFVSTKEVVTHLQERHKMEIAEVRHGIDPWGTHVVRMRLPETTQVLKAGQVLPELVIKNNFKGTSRFTVNIGFLRIACSNGLVVGHSVGKEEFRHVGDARDKAERATEFAFNGLHKASRLVGRMEERLMLEEEIEQFSRQALALRGGGIDTKALNLERRVEDHGDTLWKVFNRVQENGTKGGARYRSERGRRMTVRPLNDAGRDFKFNTQLWDLAETFLAN